MAHAERTSLAAAIALGAAVGIGLAALALRSPSSAAAVLAQWGAHLALGKETGIPVGLAAGNAGPVVFLASAALDALILLAGYPLAMALARGALRVRWLAKLKPKPSPNGAPPRHALVGMPLLAASLWIPFLPTGALAAMLVARAARYPPHAMLALLLLSIALANAAYLAIFQFALSTGAGRALLWTLAAFIALASLAIAYRRRRRSVADD